MARVRFVQAHEGRAAGDIVEMPGGIASVLIAQKVAVIEPLPPADVPVPTRFFGLDVAQKITVNCFEGIEEDGEKVDRYDIGLEWRDIPLSARRFKSEVRSLVVPAGQPVTEDDLIRFACVSSQGELAAAEFKEPEQTNEGEVIIPDVPQRIVVQVSRGVEVAGHEGLSDSYKVVHQFVEIPASARVVREQVEVIVVPAGEELEPEYFQHPDWLGQVEEFAAERVDFDLNAAAEAEGKVLYDKAVHEAIEETKAVLCEIVEFPAVAAELRDGESALAAVKRVLEAPAKTEAEAAPEAPEAATSLIQILTGSAEALERLNFASLEAVAKYEGVQIPESATKKSLCEAIVAARTKAQA